MTDIRDIITRVGETNGKNGFNEYPDLPEEHRAHYIGSQLMLVNSELGEAQDEIRTGHRVTETYFTWSAPPADFVAGFDSLEEAVGEWSEQTPGKPEGFPSEIADAVIRLFGIAYETGIDLAEIIDLKMAYNDTRGYKHGKAF